MRRKSASASARSTTTFHQGRIDRGLFGAPLHRAPASDKPPVEQILGTFDRLERGFASKDFRGCPFVNAVAELGSEDQSVKKIAIAFKESRRLWFRDLLVQLGVPDPEGLATQLTLLVDGSIAQDLVRDDPFDGARGKGSRPVLLRNAGVEIGGLPRGRRGKKPVFIDRLRHSDPVVPANAGPILRGLSIRRRGNYLLVTMAGGYGSLRSQGRQNRAARTRNGKRGATMEDLKVTASGYDFKQAQAAMQRYVDGNLLSGVSSAVSSVGIWST